VDHPAADRQRGTGAPAVDQVQSTIWATIWVGSLSIKDGDGDETGTASVARKAENKGKIIEPVPFGGSEETAIKLGLINEPEIMI
jgi:hypothetical protein